MARDSEAERVTLQRSAGELAAAATLVANPPPPIALEEVRAPIPVFDAPRARYRSIERLGIGGMGEVRRAVDGKIGREIAVKTLLANDPVGQARFLREARVQALLEHPAIVPVYDIDVGEDELPFFTMKRIRGDTLHEIIYAERSSGFDAYRLVGRNRLLRAFVTVCLAVEYAHERGVLHRDLKPANVMLGPHGEIYVLDWGIAKVLQSGDALGADLADEADEGQVVGTIGYMAPEQLLGESSRFDARTDVYALGAMLYEIITLEPLHPDEATLAMASTLQKGPRAVNVRAGVPPELSDLALRSTSYRREDRPGSARDLALAVERYLDGDRDEARRLKLADGRAELATAAMSRIESGTAKERAETRASAMRDAGHALALVPEHAVAADIVLRLLAEPPAEKPAEVIAEIAARDASFADRAVAQNAIRVISWFIGIPFALAMGIASPLGASAVVGWMVITGLASVIAWRTHHSGPRARLALFAATTVLFGGLSGLFGPFIIVPVLAAVNTVFFTAQAPRRDRHWMIPIGASTFLVPIALELGGVIPPSFEFTGGDIVLHPRLVHFPPGLTFTFLILASLLSVFTATVMTGRLRDALRDAEARLTFQKWQLGALSPQRRG